MYVYFLLRVAPMDVGIVIICNMQTCCHVYEWLQAGLVTGFIEPLPL
jgi:hypothetical protein